MKKKSLFLRLLLFTVSVIVVIFFTSMPVLESLRSKDSISAHETAAFLIENSSILPFDLLKELSIKTGTQLYIVDTDGILLFSSDSKSPAQVQHTNGDLISTRIGRYILYSSKAASQSKRFFVIFNLLYGILIAVLLFFLTRILRWRLDKITDHIWSIAKGEFESHLEVSQLSEFSDLERAVNGLSGTLGHELERLRQLSKEHMNIFDGLIDGVLVLDEESHIYMLNRSAQDYLGLKRERVLGKNILAVLLIGELRHLIESNNQLSTEYNYHDRVFTAEKLHLEGQTVFVIRDVTEQNEIKRSKTDFVSNVSHELRTPLTLIKGFAETLEVEDLSDEQKRYVNTIIRHSNRVIAIVKDLLTLSRLEQESHIEFDQVDVCNMIDEILNIYGFKAQEKQVDLRFKECSNQYVKGDRNLLEIVLSNLVDNGIKYNEEGGYVEIWPYEKDGEMLIDVRDNGIGIPKQDKTRVFERFYTVDKVRSRKVGGTGLGLAISKHIVLLHGGKITIHPNLEGGTLFRIHLPVS